jgi:hypothetical protein
MRRKLQKIKACNGVNWPEKGRKFHIVFPKIRKIILFMFLLMFGCISCDGYLGNSISLIGSQSVATAGPASLTETGTPLISTSISAVQMTGTVYAMITPEENSCQIAIAGNPLDVSIPDGTLLNPGEEFIKIWRISNGGTCIWTNQYTINWFSGDQFGLYDQVPLSKDVQPGEIVEIAVDMKAPMSAGTYQSNWKICDSTGACFGIGPKGDYPFWTKIQVRQIGTNTPSPRPTETATSIVFITKNVKLSEGDLLDLDSGEIDQPEQADIQFMRNESGWILADINQARIALFGQAVPTEQQCANLLYVSDSISLDEMDTSAVLCYKSTLGLPGYLKFISIDLENEQIDIEFLTWYVP